MLNDITFIKGQGGLGRSLPGQDYISALLFYTANGNLPVGFTTTARVKQLFSVADAENAGIKDDYNDATAATGSYLVTAIGADGDTLSLFVQETDQLLALAAYTKAPSETTVTAIGAKLAANINAGTVNHGYTASASTGTVTITAPKKFGIFLNAGTPLSAVTTGTIAGTVTQFSAGVASLQALWHYHISEFFRIQPKGFLYVGFFLTPSGAYTFADITTMQNFAVGAIRQIGVLKNLAAFATADIVAINSVCLANDAVHKPLSAVYAANMAAVNDISTVADLAPLNANKVSAVISQDAGGLGYFLFRTTGASVTNIGATLGAIALAKVSESIAWIAKFNISDGTECEVLAFANGTLYSDASVSDNLLSALNDRRYIFLRKFSGFAGSYFNDSHTAIAKNSDYAYIENNRVIDKAIRGIYVSLLPSLNSPIQLNRDGTISDTTVAYLESQAAVNLDTMIRDTEIGAFQVTINPSQNVLATDKIVIAVDLVINGVARHIEVPIGFKPSIA